MNEPVLLIMAAGMGSRYGGLKQMEPIGSGGELILDFSLYDAWMAGFKKAIFIIKKEMEEDFRAIVENKAGRFMELEYAFQDLTDIPRGFDIPEGRIKPWGTCHAVLASRHLVKGPFAVINADDYYGPDAFHKSMEFLTTAKEERPAQCCMIGYKLENTLTENGTVARGVCQVSEDGFLKGIAERTSIKRRNGCAEFTEDDGATWQRLPEGTMASMNFWGFPGSVMELLEQGLPKALTDILENNPLKGEFFLPIFVDELLQRKEASVKVLLSGDKWYGVTYKEDKEAVVAAMQAMKDRGLYPEILWK